MNCPKCGAKATHTSNQAQEYACGSWVRRDHKTKVVTDVYADTPICLRNQLAQSRRLVANLVAEKADWLEAVETSDARHRSAQEDAERYRAALEPFAAFCDWLEALAEHGDIDELKDEAIIAQAMGGGGSDALRMLDLRRARAALAERQD